MMRVVHSNRIEVLADRLAEILRDEPVSDDPFVPERVLVQNPGMGRWLALRLADTLGVAANVRFEAPLRFLYETAYRAVLGEDAAPSESSFRRDVLVWRVLREFDRLPDEPAFERLQGYVTSTGPRERQQLAREIADAFDRLTVWRPDWIRAWERGRRVLGADHPHEGWQSALWRRLVEGRDPETLDHRVAVQERFRERLRADPAAAAAALPRRVCVVGGPGIPVESFRDLVRLSAVIDVHVLFPNPCREEWSSIASRARIALERLRHEGVDDDDLHLYDGHPLLASWGRQGQAFLAALLDAEDAAEIETDDDAFVDPVEERPPTGGRDDLLRAIQSDILNLEPSLPERLPRESPSTRERVAGASPRSIQVHACHSPMRELEVLHDRLLELFDHDADLDASDVVVQIPDLETYAPFVDAVFGSAWGARRIPYVIADRATGARGRPVVDAVRAVLDLPAGRLEVGAVLDLLDVPAVRARFSLDEAAVARVREWCRETGIRWGVDAAWRRARGAHPFEGYGWRDGFDRLLAAYALAPPDVGAVGRGPVVVEGDDARTLGRFHAFTSELFELVERLGQTTTTETWARTVRRVLERLFDPADPDEEHQRLDVETAIDAVANDAREAGFDGPVHPDVLRAELAARLPDRGGGRFLAGGVTFCRTTPLRAVPFEVVALVGMNADAFPRPHRALDFDLLTARPRLGDPSPRDDDRYLFLEALLSARRHFLVTYVGRGTRDDGEIPPAVPVDELIECLNGPGERAKGDVLRPTVHPLQPFADRYGAAADDPRATDLFTYRPAPRSVPGSGRRSLVVHGLPAPGDDLLEVDLDELMRFVAHPARWFVRGRLGLDLYEEDPAPEPREPFALEGLARYALRDAMSSTWLETGDGEAALRGARIAAMIPPGAPGRATLAEERDEVRGFVERVRSLGGGGERRDVAVELSLAGGRLSGAVTVLADRAVFARPATLQGKDRLPAWVAHLALCAGAAPSVTTTCIGIDAEVRFDPVTADVATAALETVVAAYREAHRRPVPLFPRSSYAYARAAHPEAGGGRDPDDAALRALYDERTGGEASDAHVAVLWPDGVEVDRRFRELASEVCGPLVDAELRGRR